MGIELGSIGSAVGSAVSSLPAPAIDIGGHLGSSLGQGMDFLGSKMGSVDIGSIVKEGPAGFLGLENTMPIIQAPKPSILGDVQYDSLIGPSIAIRPAIPDSGGVSGLLLDPDVALPKINVPEAEAITAPVFQPWSEVKQVQDQVYLNPKIIEEPVNWSAEEPKAVKLEEGSLLQTEPEAMPIPAPKILKFPKSQGVVSPDLEPATEIQTSSGVQASAKLDTESRVSSQSIPAALVQPELEEEIEEIIEQATNQQEGIDSDEVVNTEVSKIKIVESVKTSKERRDEIIAAISRAIRLGITVKDALSSNFWRLISPLVKGRKDWTIDLTANELNINPASYASVEQLQKLAIVSVANNTPVEEGEGGRQATIGEVRKVIYGEDDKLKPRTPAVIVSIRVAKKKVATKSSQSWVIEEDRTEAVQENSLEGLKLKEVFQKAIK